MDPNDVLAVRAPVFSATPDEDVPFPADGTLQLLGGSGDNAMGGRIRGWWILANDDPPDNGACFIDLHDGTSVSDRFIIRIGMAKGGHEDDQAQAAMVLPGHGLRFDNGIFLSCVSIETGGTFYQMEIYYQ